MRFLILVFVGLLAGCFGCVGATNESAAIGDDADEPPPNGGSVFCQAPEDCRLASATCCECPTFAVRFDDPKAAVCDDLECETECPDNVEATCNVEVNSCELACKPLQCLQTCEFGFAVEANGCLSCTCAMPSAPMGGCTVDADCVQTRADCCGCEMGGADTAVLASDQQSFDSSLMCPPSSQCPPQQNNCDPDASPHCLQGQCALLPDRPADACGTPDLPPCPSGTTCTVNANDQANLYGLGVCRP